MLTDISLNSRDVPIITVENPKHGERPALSKEQISAGVVEALELHRGHVHRPKTKTQLDAHSFCGRSPENCIQFTNTSVERL